MQSPVIVIAYVLDGVDGRGLRTEVRELGERVGAELRHMAKPTSYWELFEELWTGDRDFVVWEEDVLPTMETIHSMAACDQSWCSGTFGRWFWHPINGRRVLWSDACLGLVRFSARLQRHIPDLLVRAATRYPGRAWWELDRGLIRRGILDEEEAVSPHLHFPRMRHLRLPDPDYNGGLWDRDRYVADLAERAHLRSDQPVEDLGPRIGLRW